MPIGPTRISSFWVGIDGSGSDSVEQIGTGAECLGRATKVYYAWWEMMPQPMVRIAMAIHPGDSISARVSAAGSRFTLSIWNNTTGKHFSIQRSNPNAERSSAEWIAEATTACEFSACNVAPLPDFAYVRFHGGTATIDGRTGSIGEDLWDREQDVMTPERHIRIRSRLSRPP